MKGIIKGFKNNQASPGGPFLRIFCKSGNNLNKFDRCKPFRPKPPVTTLAPPVTSEPPEVAPVTTPITSEIPEASPEVSSPVPITTEAITSPEVSQFVPQDLPPASSDIPSSEAPPSSPEPTTSEAPPSSPFVPQDLPPPEAITSEAITSEAPPTNPAPITSEAPPSSQFVPQDLPPPPPRDVTSPSFEITFKEPPPTIVGPPSDTNQKIAIGVGVSILGLILIGLLILYIRNIKK